MQKKTIDDYSASELKIFYTTFSVIATIMAIIGLALLPFGLFFIVIGFAFFCQASRYKKAMKETLSYENKLKEELKDYVIIDFETTGLNPKSDRIIEIGAIKVRNNEIVDTYSTFVNPMKHIAKRITDINGISDETVVDAPFEKDVLPEIGQFITGEIIVGYNITFDLSFLSAALDRYAVDFVPGITVDVLKLARKHIAGVENHKLETVMKIMEPNYVQEHRALRDCCAIKKMLDYLKQNAPICELL